MRLAAGTTDTAPASDFCRLARAGPRSGVPQSPAGRGDRDETLTFKGDGLESASSLGPLCPAGYLIDGWVKFLIYANCAPPAWICKLSMVIPNRPGAPMALYAGTNASDLSALVAQSELRSCVADNAELPVCSVAAFRRAL